MLKHKNIVFSSVLVAIVLHFWGYAKMIFSVGFNKILNLIWVSKPTQGILEVTSYPDSILEILGITLTFDPLVLICRMN